MNPWWDGFIKGVLLGEWVMIVIGIIHHKRLRKLKREEEESRQESLKRAFLRGRHIGAVNHACWINENSSYHFNGFAMLCEECRDVFSAITDAREEYVRCPKCQHRNPAPLAPEKEVSRGR